MYATSNKTVKYLIGNLYKISSDLINETDKFIDEVANLLTVINSKTLKTYICGYYNLNLLKINSDTKCSTLFGNLTSFGFIPKISLSPHISRNADLDKKTTSICICSFSELSKVFWIGASSSASNVMRWISTGTELSAYLSGSFEYFESPPVTAAIYCLYIKYSGIWLSSDCIDSMEYICKI